MSEPVDLPPRADVVNMKTLPLPPELRLDIHDLVFDGLFLHIDIPNRFPQQSSIYSERNIRSDASKNAAVPGLLAVSKTTRNEALESYARLVPPVFHCPSKEWESRPGSMLPMTFLRNATVAYIANFHVTGVDNGLMPNLEELRIGGPPTGATEGIIEEVSPDDPQLVYEAFKHHYFRHIIH